MNAAANRTVSEERYVQNDDDDDHPYGSPGIYHNDTINKHQADVTAAIEKQLDRSDDMDDSHEDSFD